MKNASLMFYQQNKYKVTESKAYKQLKCLELRSKQSISLMSNKLEEIEYSELLQEYENKTSLMENLKALNFLMLV